MALMPLPLSSPLSAPCCCSEYIACYEAAVFGPHKFAFDEYSRFMNVVYEMVAIINERAGQSRDPGHAQPSAAPSHLLPPAPSSSSSSSRPVPPPRPSSPPSSPPPTAAAADSDSGRATGGAHSPSQSHSPSPSFERAERRIVGGRG